MSKTHWYAALAAVAIVGGAAAFHFGKTSSAPAAASAGTAPSGMPPVNMQAQTPPAITADQQAELDAGAAAHAPSALTFDIHGGSFYFVPNEIHVKKGDTVTLTFHNDGGFHDLTLDEFAVKIAHVATGATGSATFVADKTGSFQYYCSVGHHRAMGQWGTIVVE
jgi:plastocyanin